MKTVLEPGEELVYVAKKHWLVYFYGFVLAGLLLMISWLFFKKFDILFIIIAFGILFYFYKDRQSNLCIVTTSRFIREWGIITKNVIDTPVDKINNVSFMKDILGILFNYGNVEIQSAAEQGVIIVKMLQNPEKFISKVQLVQQKKLSDSVKKCPYCKEIIKADALVCRFCGRDVSGLSDISICRDTVVQNFNQHVCKDYSQGSTVTEEEKKQFHDSQVDNLETNSDKKSVFSRRVNLWEEKQ